LVNKRAMRLKRKDHANKRANLANYKARAAEPWCIIKKGWEAQ
jgi:hypothetical protein